MREWVIVTIMLLLWTSVYCTRAFAADFRRGARVGSLWGLVALAGPLSAVAFFALMLVLWAL